ncbi:nuclease [Dispira simplex]|nr:nuclease [Dispira simplex]
MHGLTNQRLAFFLGGSLFGALLTISLTRPKANAPVVVPTPPSPPPSPPKERLPPKPPVPTTKPTLPIGNIELLKSLQMLGFPGPVADTRNHSAYVSNWNRHLRNPNWVFEHLTRDNIRRPPKDGKDEPDRTHSNFREDKNIPPTFRSLLKDYFKSGYDRGHLVPAADAKRSQEAMDETFLLSNISPQVGQGFNRDYWAYFETFTRRLTKHFSDVYVFTGPLYLPKPIPGSSGRFKMEFEVIGNPPNVAVPTHFYKVIVARDAQGSYALEGFVLPNAIIPDDTPLDSFVTPIDAIEKAAGLIFFDNMPQLRDPRLMVSLCSTTQCSLTESQAYIDAIKKKKALNPPQA